jgi:hypothetical protein
MEEEDRRELRADFQHLRRWRESVEQAQSYTFKAIITVIVAGVLGGGLARYQAHAGQMIGQAGLLFGLPSRHGTCGGKASDYAERSSVSWAPGLPPAVSNCGLSFSWRSSTTNELKEAEQCYRIREVDGLDEETSDSLAELHRLTFPDCAPVPDFGRGNWWLAYRERLPVGFAGVVPSTHVENAGYFRRVGVLRAHHGHALQLRMMRAIETSAGQNGWCLRCFRYDEESLLCKQLHSGGIPALPAETPMGVVQYTVLAKAHQAFRTP